MGEPDQTNAELAESLRQQVAQLQATLAELAKANEALRAEIAERKRAHEDARAAEARHRAIVEDQTELICRFLPDTTLTFVNGAYCRAFASTPEQLIGRRFLPFIPESERARVCALFESLNAERPHATHEHPVLAPDGTRRWQQWTNRAICDEQGRVVEYQAVGRDVTERKRAEEELKYHLELERLVTGISSGFIHLPPEEVDREIDGALETIGAFAEADRSYVFQFSDDLARASNTHEWCADGIAPAIDGLQDMPVGRFPWALERHRRGEIVHVPRVCELPDEAGPWKQELEREGVQSLLCVPMACAGRVLGFVGFDAVRSQKAWPSDFIALLRIVGEIFANALERRRAEEALRLSELRYRTTLDSMVDAIHLTDPDLRIVLFNAAFRNWSSELGLPTDVIGRGLFEAFPFLPDSVREEYRRVFETGEPLVAVETTELAGRQIITETRKIPVFKGGRVARVITIVRDITRERRAEEELQRAERLRALSLLAGGIAHDFNNMLMGVMATISLAKLDEGTGPDIVELLEEAEESVLRAKGLAQQLLTFSRGGAPVLRAASIGELLRPTARFALTGSNVRCQLALPDDLWAAEIDVGQISQVVQNLVINAKQAMPTGGVVEISAENLTLEPDELPPLPPGRYVKVAVADRGVGIPAERLPRIFDPYFTTRGAGSGLGLAVCHSIVAKHKGHIRVDSEPGVGTTFEVFLPASRATVSPTREERPAMVERRGRILLMDDDDLVRRGARRMLEVVGYEVECAEDGAQAIGAYRRAAEAGQPFDVVLLDLTVPGGMGGLECIGELIEIDPDVRAIVSSGYSEDPIMAEFSDHGFRGVVPKPYTIEELIDALRHALGEQGEQD